MAVPLNIPLSLYVHVPWCIKKCPYCDFNSHVQNEPPWRDYVDALLVDLEKEYASCADRQIETIFFGGGTPSLMPGEAFGDLMRGIGARVEMDPECEITLEANPGSVDADNFNAYYEAGVNRLSIGAQSFRNKQLALLGRVHKVDAIMKTYLVAQSIGFENLNIDLMHSLPNDTTGGALSDLKQAIALRPKHLSWYELTIEPGTGFEKKPPLRPDHEQIIEQHELGIDTLAMAEYQRYEVSAFAQAGFECKHNLNYWQFGDYIGIGAGAHGKITTNDSVYRTEKRLNPMSYLKGVVHDDHAKPQRPLAKSDLITDFMINAFRINRGFTSDLFETRTGLSFDEIAEQLTVAREKKLINCSEGVVLPTEHGLRFLNDLQLLFYT